MTDKENYQKIVDSIFGPGIVSIKLDTTTNHVIGALNSSQFQVFTDAFRDRLTRLHKRYMGTSSFNSLITVVQQISDEKNWDGAYGELSAYDILTSSIPTTIELDQTLAGDKTFAKEWGKTESNEDGYWKSFDSFFDVKILSDPSKAIIKKVINSAIAKAGSKKKCTILPEYNLEEPESEYQLKIPQLINELTSALCSSPSTSFYQSKEISHLSYRIHWGGGVNSAENSYNPYLHAEKTKDLLFKRYTYKILKRKPFFIVFVNFPWFEQLVQDFDKMNEVYYRALSRRTFCQYLHSNKKMKDIYPKYANSSDTIRKVSMHLTGIVFIEDYSVTGEENKVFTYLNPNAKHYHRSMDYYLRGISNGVFETFAFDNY